MPGRSFSSGNYRYGFNGKENDNEVKGDGNQQDYGLRIYDSRLGRFLSVDPLVKSFPWYTSYQFSGNNPIEYIDLDGGEQLSNKKKVQETWYGNAQTGVVDFTKAFYLTVVNVLGALSELPGQAHIKPVSQQQRDNAFPLTKGQNIKSLAVGTVAAPIYAIGGVANDPKNPAKWGEAAGTLVFYRGFFKSKGSSLASEAKTEVLVKNRTPQVGEQFVSYIPKIENGKINISGRAVTNGTFDFVITNSGELKIGTGHYNLSGGAESVKAAGQIKIFKGQVTTITNSSGHYQPSVAEGAASVSALKDAGVNTSGATVKLYNSSGALEKSFKSE